MSRASRPRTARGAPGGRPPRSRQRSSRPRAPRRDRRPRTPRPCRRGTRGRTRGRPRARASRTAVTTSPARPFPAWWTTSKAIPRRRDARQRGRHEPIQDLCALAAADDEDPQPPFLRPRDERGNLEERGTDGVARDDRPRQRRRAAGSSDRDAARETRQDPVRETRNGVLLVDERRNSPGPCRGHERAGGVTAHADDRAGRVPGEEAQRVEERQGQRAESVEARAPALADEPLRADELERRSRPSARASSRARARCPRTRSARRAAAAGSRRRARAPGRRARPFLRPR